MNQKQGKKESKLTKCLKSPIRILTKARDFYIRSITKYSDRICYGTAMVCPTGHLNTLPRSFSVSSTKSSTGDEDLRELIRAASTRSLGNQIQADLLQQQQGRQSTKTGPYIVLRSQSIGIGRIEEDKPCEFGEDTNVQTTIFPRSLSYAAVGKRKGTVL